jgi:hypothetical protein
MLESTKTISRKLFLLGFVFAT